MIRFFPVLFFVGGDSATAPPRNTIIASSDHSSVSDSLHDDSQQIPVFRDANGFPFLRLEDDLYVTLGERSFCPIYRYTGILNPRYSVGSHMVYATVAVRNFSIGIGPLSEFIEQVESVGVIRNPYRLVTGMRFEDFEANCQSGIMAHFPIGQDFHGRMSLSQFTDGIRLWYSLGRVSFSEHRHRFPRRLATAIENYFAQNSPSRRYGGGVIGLRELWCESDSDDSDTPMNDPELIRIDDCDTVTISQAPTIHIRIENVVDFVLYPTDYVRHDHRRNICTLLFTSSLEYSEDFAIAPLTIPDANVFINATRFSICD